MFWIGNYLTITVFASDFDIGGNFGNTFQPIFGGRCSIIRRATGKNLNTVDIIENGFSIFTKIFGDKPGIQKDFGGI